MEKLNLTPEEIFNKSFESSIRGYNADDVDAYLDLILEDYQTMESNVQELLDMINNLQDQIKKMQQEQIELKGKQKAIDLSNTTQYSSVDILKRISRLEEMVIKK